MTPLSYFQTDDVVALAEDLVGKVLMSTIDGQTVGGVITETEAYRAPEDKASHAYNGRRTPRTEVMYHSGGRSYVYLCYGIHHLLNIVTGPEKTPHAILIRGIEPAVGIEVMEARRGGKRPLASGPGTVSQALGVTTAHNGVILGKTLWIEEGAQKRSGTLASCRIGIDYAEEWASKPWRFQLQLKA